MAYRKRASIKKRSSRKRVSKSKMSMPSKTERKRHALTTDYAKALLDPVSGPLVGVPQFVPIDTHRARVKAIGTVSTTTGALNVFFNPCRMGSNNAGPILYGTENSASALTEASNIIAINSNAEHSNADYQISGNGEDITNGDGVRSRVVAAMIRVTNVSSDNVRDGVFHALHENHHKTLEDMTLAQISTQNNSIVVSAADGKPVTLLYRPVKPQEVDEWQKTPWHLPGKRHCLLPKLWTARSSMLIRVT